MEDVIETKRDKWVIHMINAIAEDISEGDFQFDFYESLCDQWQKNKRLSENQVNALEKMYERIC